VEHVFLVVVGPQVMPCFYEGQLQDLLGYHPGNQENRADTIGEHQLDEGKRGSLGSRQVRSKIVVDGDAPDLIRGMLVLRPVLGGYPFRASSKAR
jgi:hypothetical protein